ncbi:hypothetical protein P1X15_17495 [Runella sp. MFBS21]|uniref:hypothetical protein n=1 Tax=Runella sp. MFBS21 TaxID=3034018 RepID=UPI0023F61E29|nr:hypothetical protein [Runella sp. MFBS21]MDF7819417.1 hypothetical protein [Runella sp. MFBS21]
MSRIFRFALGLYSRDVTTHSENTAARISFVAGVFSLLLVIVSFVFSSSSTFVFAAVLGGVAVGFGVSGLIHRTSLLANKYANHPNVRSLGYKKSCAGIALGMMGVGVGIYFY